MQRSGAVRSQLDPPNVAASSNCGEGNTDSGLGATHVPHGDSSLTVNFGTANVREHRAIEKGADETFGGGFADGEGLRCARGDGFGRLSGGNRVNMYWHSGSTWKWQRTSEGEGDSGQALDEWPIVSAHSISQMLLSSERSVPRLSVAAGAGEC